MKIPLFDIDGTLVKTNSPINQNAFSYAVKKVYGIKASHLEIDPEGMVDNEILIEILKLHNISEEKVKSKILNYKNAVEEFAAKNIKELSVEILPGVKSLLVELKKSGTTMGILSGNVEGLAWSKLESVNLKEYFSFGAFGSEAYKRIDLVEIARKKAQIILKRDVNLKEFAIIGDTPKDIKCAKDAGIKVLVVPTGNYLKEELEKQRPDVLVSSLEEKDKVINFLNN